MNQPRRVTAFLQRDSARVHLVLMLVLTFSTGVIDAVGYLALDRVFTANMTGNVVILGMALTGADGLPVIGPALALVGFGAGAAVAGRLLRRADNGGWSTRSTIVFSVVGAVLAAVAVFVGVSGSSPEPVAFGITAVLGVAMGLQAGAARHLAVKDVTTVVVTSTLTGLAADSWLGARASAHPWRRRVAAIALIGIGAVVGALALRVGLWFGIAIPAVVTLVVAAVGHLSATREESAHE